ncbi:MAG: hypothetical protein ACI89J_004596 [Hyphomicrobiaceae bacterium]|jgi:hypothetical protein
MQIPKREYKMYEFWGFVEITAYVSVMVLAQYQLSWWTATLVGVATGIWNASRRYRNVWHPAFNALNAPTKMRRYVFVRTQIRTAAVVSVAFTALYFFGSIVARD